VRVVRAAGAIDRSLALIAREREIFGDTSSSRSVGPTLNFRSV